MILPDKYIKIEDSLLGVGYIILQRLDKPANVSALWEALRTKKEISSYNRFVYALDMLFIMGVVNIDSKGCLFREYTEICAND